MRLSRATELITACAEQMNARYEGVVFDEWAVLSLGTHRARLHYYVGPCKKGFRKNLLADPAALCADLALPDYGVGDFKLALTGVSPPFAGFMVLGRGRYLVCNNTVHKLDSLASSPRGLVSQVPFIQLSERFRASPLELDVSLSG